ncbi:MAG: alpha/beta fold hydrolase [Chloroflexota bacterium]
MLEARPWGFSLQEISMPIHIWHGEQDRIVPIEQGRIQAKTIPNAHARFFPNEGHTLGVNHTEELLDTLVANYKEQ